MPHRIRASGLFWLLTAALALAGCAPQVVPLGDAALGYGLDAKAVAEVPRGEAPFLSPRWPSRSRHRMARCYPTGSGARKAARRAPCCWPCMASTSMAAISCSTASGN
ncbi:hypothetical protein ACFQU7_15530 [Pseudoroseomonas wenyumeiae]